MRSEGSTFASGPLAATLCANVRAISRRGPAPLPAVPIIWTRSPRSRSKKFPWPDGPVLLTRASYSGLRCFQAGIRLTQRGGEHRSERQVLTSAENLKLDLGAGWFQVKTA